MRQLTNKANGRRVAWMALGLILLGGVALGACGGDDNAATNEGDGGSSSGSSSGASSGSSSGTSSGSSSGTSSGSSSGTSSGSSSGTSSGSSSGAGEAGTDGGAQDFSVFVKGLIANDTTSSALPTPLPADGTYTDNQSLADYPASFF
jgi:hypothetical protein